MSFHRDTRDVRGAPSNGYVLRGGASAYPELLDVSDGAFGEIHGQIAGFLSPAPYAGIGFAF